MSVDSKPKCDVDEYLLTTWSATPQELHPFLESFRLLHRRKSWHKLTLKLLAFFDHPLSKPYRIDVFDRFIRDFESQLNQHRLAEMGVKVSNEIGDDSARSQFLQDLLARINADTKPTPEAEVLLLSHIARAKLVSGDIEGAKEEIDKAKDVLTELTAMHHRVLAAYCDVAADYYMAKAQYHWRYEMLMSYLRCISDVRKDLTLEERVARAHDLGIAALLSEKTGNFVYVLAQPVMRSLDQSEYWWIKELMIALDYGRYSRAEALVRFSVPKEQLSQKEYERLAQRVKWS